jgi:hypothetical protein
VEAQKTGPKCGFGTILRSLAKEDLAYYDQMIADGLAHSYIAAVFREDGHDVSADKVRRHRKGECACP